MQRSVENVTFFTVLNCNYELASKLNICEIYEIHETWYLRTCKSFITISIDSIAKVDNPLQKSSPFELMKWLEKSERDISDWNNISIYPFIISIHANRMRSLKFS